jgi:hypothetical protein
MATRERERRKTSERETGNTAKEMRHLSTSWSSQGGDKI